MVRRTARTIGASAEQRAKRFLLQNGLHSVASNFRCRFGEIDLIMQDSECLVFAEVRYRAGRRLAPASLTVNIHKQRKLIRTAAIFLARWPEFRNCTVRFDVLAIEADTCGGETIEWIRDAFYPPDSSL